MAMLEIYAKAWVVDKEMADLIRDAWYRGEIDDQDVRLAWCLIARQKSCNALS